MALASSSSKEAFLVLHGSFNPVHTDHVATLAAARRRLQDAGWNVRAGILAPTDKDHVIRKCGDDTINDVHRFALLNLACLSQCEWLRCDLRLANYLSN